MIDTEALKRIIIDKATSGLLSSWCVGDDTVDELISNLPSLSNKRKQLLSQTFDYDEKVDIPEHWRWVKLGEISSYGDTPAKIFPDDMQDGLWVLELEDIESGGELIVKKRYPDRKPAGEKTKFVKGQLLYSKLRPYLKKVLIADEDGVSTPELISFDVFCDINVKYISYCLVNSYVDKAINKRSYGVKMPRVDVGFMVNLPIPLPPISEQERIVKLVETAFLEIDKISKLQKQYESNCEILKGKIIDAGIHGKLTEQLSEDGDADDLYAQIQEEKARLIKEGKLKKEKPFPAISEDEIPFEIPKNWKWVRLRDICSFMGGYAYKSELYIDYSDNQIIRLGNVKQNNLLLDAKPVFISNELANETEEYRIKENDVLVTMTGTKKRKDYFFAVRVNKEDLNEKNLYLNQRVGCIRTIGKQNISFLVTALQNTEIRNHIFEYETGAVNQGNLGSNDIQSHVIIPFPPLSEQKRIAEKIDSILALLSLRH